MAFTLEAAAALLSANMNLIPSVIALLIYAVGIKLLSETVIKQLVVSENYFVVHKRNMMLILAYLALLLLGVRETLVELFVRAGTLQTIATGLLLASSVAILVAGIMSKNAEF